MQEMYSGHVGTFGSYCWDALFPFKRRQDWTYMCLEVFLEMCKYMLYPAGDMLREFAPAFIYSTLMFHG